MTPIMSLTERYLRAVAAQLPRADRDDIVAELRDAIQTRMEDRQEALGRPLTEAEEEAVLREVGHPLTVAARYGAGPQHIVGPELYPWWMFGVKVALAALGCITVIGIILRVTVGDIDAAQAIGQAFHSLFNGAIMIVGLATVAAYVIERQTEKPAFIRDWRVKDLGLFEIAAFDAEGLSRGLSEGGRAVKTPGEGAAWKPNSMSPAARGVASAIGWGVFLMWWTGLLTTPQLRPMEFANSIDGVNYGLIFLLTWGMIFWPVIGYAAARIVFGLARAVAPASVRLTALGDLLLSTARAVFYGWLWLASPLSQVIRVDSLQAFIDRLSHMIHTQEWTLAVILMLVVAIGFVMSLFEGSGALWRLVTGQPSPGQGVMRPSVI